jgi:ABC-type antimicrobial peptide transport system permease subunit
MALGASSGVLIGLVLGQIVRLAAVGLVVGCVLALGVSRLFAWDLYVIDTYDPLGYAAGAGIVFASCLFAAYVPSRRAATVNPVDALRADG